jgi:hypothetical protein
MLGVAFPPLDGEETLVALPLVLPMGWVNSLPNFCSATDAVANITNQRVLHHDIPAPHRLDEIAETFPPSEPTPAILPSAHGSPITVAVPLASDPALKRRTKTTRPVRRFASIPPDQKRTSVCKWYKVLGELRSR